MKRRYANSVEGLYTQKRFNGENFKGYISNIKIQNVEKPLIVNNGISKVCIKDNGFEWFEVYPDNANYAITIMYDDKNNLIEWYFDIAKKIGVENGVPYEDDLYLDVVVLPNRQSIILDEKELIEAFNMGYIQQSDVDLAYSILKLVEEKYVKKFEDLISFTNFIRNSF